VGLAEGFELGVVFGGGDGEVDEGAAAVGAGVFGEGDAVRLGVDLIEVADEFVVMEMPVGEFGAEGLFGGGDGGVGVGAFGEVVVEGGDFDGGGGEGEEEEEESAHGGISDFGLRIADCGFWRVESGEWRVDGEIMWGIGGFLLDLFVGRAGGAMWVGVVRLGG
jgi:hypothetical protein